MRRHTLTDLESEVRWGRRGAAVLARQLQMQANVSVEIIDLGLAIILTQMLELNKPIAKKEDMTTT